MSGRDPWAQLRAHVEPQRGYLHTPLPAGRGVCSVCRGPVSPSYPRCFPCNQHHEAANGLTANVVAPISYAVKREQHAHNLAVYKATPSPELVRTRLISLLMVFLADHARCLYRATGATGVDAAAVVPSTRGRTGPHPLQTLVDGRLGVPLLSLSVNSGISAASRDFHPQKFTVSGSPGPPRLPLHGKTVLLLDDTWTTGSRIQSAAFTLKSAGAARVLAIVLGRHARPEEHPPWRPIIEAAKQRPFDPADCVVHR